MTAITVIIVVVILSTTIIIFIIISIVINMLIDILIIISIMVVSLLKHSAASQLSSKLSASWRPTKLAAPLHSVLTPKHWLSLTSALLHWVSGMWASSVLLFTSGSIPSDRQAS